MKIESPLLILLSAVLFSCSDQAVDPATFSSDAAIFAYLTQEDPYGSYALFPHADSVTTGTLNGSTAHRPMVRVSMNAKGIASLADGRFPDGGSFQTGSVILKEIRDTAGTIVWAVVVKEPENSNAQGGWLWAEYQPDGDVVYSIENKGAGCVSCHSLEEGTQHDLIRTFERQKP